MSILEKIRAWLLKPILDDVFAQGRRDELAIGNVDSHLLRMSLDFADHRKQLFSVLAHQSAQLDIYLDQIRLLDNHLRELNVAEDYNFDKLNKEVQQLNARTIERTIEIEKLIMYRFGVVDKKFEVLEKLGAGIEKVEKELDNIRSRYQWVEERYQDITKGNAPRDFDFEHRQ